MGPSSTTKAIPRPQGMWASMWQCMNHTPAVPGHKVSEIPRKQDQRSPFSTIDGWEETRDSGTSKNNYLGRLETKSFGIRILTWVIGNEADDGPAAGGHPYGISHLGIHQVEASLGDGGVVIAEPLRQDEEVEPV